jgi:hypothetical protein
MNENEIDVIYDRYGAPALRLLNNGRLVTFRGESVGFLVDENLFNYSGEYVGYFENGVMRDKNSQCVGFNENASDYPAPFFPYTQYKPYPSYVEYEPYRPYTHWVSFKPYKSFSWSDKDPISLFSSQ